MSNIITSDVIGPSPGCAGIGNQLFQIASVLSYSKDNGHKAIFPIIKSPNHGGYFNNFLRRLCTDDFEGPACVFTESSFDFKPIPVIDKSVVIKNSYLQSHRYFQHNRDHILKMFEMTDEDLNYLKSKYKVDEFTTGMHIRRGDYLELPYSNYHADLTSTDYYERALDLLKPSNLLIFTNDKEWARERYPGHVIADEDKDYMEIYLMSLCQNNIIANSSFSWWGAWLNNNQDRKIVAPTKWFGPLNAHLSTKDMHPKDWILI